jgi:peptide/nickel transport system permease protein
LPTTNASTGEVQIFDFDFHTLGAVYGLLGTDNRGRDIFSRIIYGTRISLEVGLLVACLSTAIGVAAGVASGYFGGAFDEVSMRLVDLMMCLPFFPLLLAFADMFQRNLWIIMFLIVLWGWGGLARIVRSQVLSLREMPFIEAAVATGASKTYILRKHILPNVFPLIFSFLVLAVPGAILTESGLSFLGLGDPTLVTWGRIINEAMNGGALAANAWWWLFAPGVAIVLVCLSFVLVARAFDKIVNPRLRTRT